MYRDWWSGSDDERVQEWTLGPATLYKSTDPTGRAVYAIWLFNHEIVSWSNEPAVVGPQALSKSYRVGDDA